MGLLWDLPESMFIKNECHAGVEGRNKYCPLLIPRLSFSQQTHGRRELSTWWSSVSPLPCWGPPGLFRPSSSLPLSHTAPSSSLPSCPIQSTLSVVLNPQYPWLWCKGTDDYSQPMHAEPLVTAAVPGEASLPYCGWIRAGDTSRHHHPACGLSLPLLGSEEQTLPLLAFYLSHFHAH